MTRGKWSGKGGGEGGGPGRTAKWSEAWLAPLAAVLPPQSPECPQGSLDCLDSRLLQFRACHLLASKAQGAL